MCHEIVPILRIFDEDKAKEFYLGFLEFNLESEHRYAEDFPVYMQISKGSVTIHLSEHHGDGNPGAALRIRTEKLSAFCAKLNSKEYKYAKPGIEDTPWNSKEMTVLDPFGNRLVFYETI